MIKYPQDRHHGASNKDGPHRESAQQHRLVVGGKRKVIPGPAAVAGLVIGPGAWCKPREHNGRFLRRRLNGGGCCFSIVEIND